MATLKSHSEIDFWRFPEHVMVSPEKLPFVEQFLAENNIGYKVNIQDVQNLIDADAAKYVNKKELTTLADYDFTRYYTGEEIDAWVKEIALAYPALAIDFVVGTSYEGREMRGLQLQSLSRDPNAVWISAGSHAREWAGIHAAMLITEMLLQEYGVDPDVTKFLDENNIYILPVMNPDGYAYSWDVNRLWRKTRSTNSGSSCIGTDCNRNFDFQWLGGNTNPCSEEYRGDSPLSEPEIQAMTDYIRGVPEKFILYFEVFSYGQFYLTPWGYSAMTTPDYIEQQDCAGQTASASQAVHGYQFLAGDVVNSGGGMGYDWAYGSLGITHSLAGETRDRGEYGFNLPEDQIIPSGEEMYAGFKAALNCAMGYNE
ncbi:carboxypeptidase B-like [Glandiceps talaboti]